MLLNLIKWVFEPARNLLKKRDESLSFIWMYITSSTLKSSVGRVNKAKSAPRPHDTTRTCSCTGAWLSVWFRCRWLCCLREDFFLTAGRRGASWHLHSTWSTTDTTALAYVGLLLMYSIFKTWRWRGKSKGRVSFFYQILWSDTNWCQKPDVGKTQEEKAKSQRN